MITSTSNQQMRQVRDLLNKSKERKKQQCFVAEGLRMVMETPADRLVKCYVSESFYRQPPAACTLPLDESRVVADAVFKQIADTQHPQGIMAVVKQQENDLNVILKNPQPLLLCLENIQDPGNLGTMMRTAEGAGVTGIIMSKDTVDIYNPKTIRSTMGSLYRMPFVYAEDFCSTMVQVKEAGIAVYAAHLKGTESYAQMDYKASTAFMIGNEGNGLTDAAANLATHYIRIPMAGKVESLNAAIAATVLMYEANRQRN